MTTKREQNLAVLEGYFAAMAEGPAAAMPFYSENVELTVPGNHAASGTHVGHDGVSFFGGTMARLTNRSFRLVPIDLFASDDRVVTYANASAEVNGEKLEWLRVIVSEVTLAEDGSGQLSKLRFFESDQAAVDALLNSAA